MQNDERNTVLQICEWCDCNFSCLLADGKGLFLDHVYKHIEDLIELSSNDLPENERELQCLWRNCTLDALMNGQELAKHVMYHAFHTYLKSLGLAMQIQKQLPTCTLSSDSQNLVDNDGEELICYWQDCRRRFYSPDQFYRHIEYHVIDESSSENLFHCRWLGCQSNFKVRYKLKEHCRVHTGERVIACYTCGGLFASNTKYMDHLNRQSEEGTLQCICCNKQFSTKRLLRNHERGHVNSSKCTVCNMTFPSRSGLQRHMLYRHTDHRPYECEKCGLQFKSVHDLNRHEKIHDDQVLLCPKEGCNYTSKFLQSIKLHYSKEHENEFSAVRYACHICGCRYSRGRLLTMHLKKKHHFEWSSNMPRFIYYQCDDGMYRLQTVRFESVELQLGQDNPNSNHIASGSSLS